MAYRYAIAAFAKCTEICKNPRGFVKIPHLSGAVWGGFAIYLQAIGDVAKCKLGAASAILVGGWEAGNLFDYYGSGSNCDFALFGMAGFGGFAICR